MRPLTGLFQDRYYLLGRTLADSDASGAGNLNCWFIEVCGHGARFPMSNFRLAN
jgi:hypothetical protein